MTDAEKNNFEEDCKVFDKGELSAGEIDKAELLYPYFRYSIASFLGLLMFGAMLGGSFAAAGGLIVLTGIKSGLLNGVVLGGVLVIGGPIFAGITFAAMEGILPAELEPLRRRRTNSLVLTLMILGLPVVLGTGILLREFPAFDHFFKESTTLAVCIIVILALSISTVLSIAISVLQDRKFRKEIKGNLEIWEKRKKKRQSKKRGESEVNTPGRHSDE